MAKEIDTSNAKFFKRPLTVPEFAEALEISTAAAYAQVKRLLSAKAIKTAGKATRENVRGPKPVLYVAA